MMPHELAASLQRYYGEQGMVVYDRRDRWKKEHSTCHKDHEHRTTGGIVIDYCFETNSVLVVANEPMMQSECGRCLRGISEQEFTEYMAGDHLCHVCQETSDSTYAQRIKAAEKRTRDSVAIPRRAG